MFSRVMGLSRAEQQALTATPKVYLQSDALQGLKVSFKQRFTPSVY